MVNISQLKISKLQLIFYVLMLSILVFVQVGTKYHLDYVIVSPGTADPTSRIVHIEGAKSYDSKGEIRFLTVLVTTNRPVLLEYLKSKYLEKDNEFIKWDEIRGNVNSKDELAHNKQEMSQSQNAAKIVALNELGCDVKQTGNGALVTQVVKGGPAALAKIDPGSIITAIDAKTVTSNTEAIDILKTHNPDDEITLTIKNGDVSRDLKVVLGSNPEKPKASFLGVVLSTSQLTIDFPVGIKIDEGDVSGPSAGLAFSLTIIDKLTKGDLTGGKDYAITGEIGPDGTVYPVGGVKQKAVAARKAGAKFMIVPKSEAKDAKKTAGNMKIFEVKNIDEALDVFAKNGGVPLPHVRACPNS